MSRIVLKVCTHHNAKGKECLKKFWTRIPDRKNCAEHGGYSRGPKRLPRIAKRIKSQITKTEPVKKGKKK